MRNPYMAVAKAYLHNWLLWVQFFLFGIPLLMMFSMTDSHRPLGERLTQVVFFLWLMPMMAATFLKEQFANPRARLLPGFGRAHLAGAAGMVLLFVITMDLVALICHWSVPGTSAFVLAAAAMCGWMVIIPAWMQLVVFLSLLIGLSLSTRAPALLAGILQAKDPAVVMGLLVGSVVALIALGRRLLALSEEHPAYQIGRSIRGTGKPPETFPNVLGRNLAEHRLERVLSAHGEGLWSTAQRLRAATGMISSIWIALGICVIGFTVAVTLIMLKTMHIQVVNMSVIAMSIFVLALIWSPWRNTLQREALKPLTRTRLVQSMFLALAVENLQLWLIVAASLLPAKAMVLAWGNHSVSAWLPWPWLAVWLSLFVLCFGFLSLCLLIKSDRMWTFAIVATLTGACPLIAGAAVQGDFLAAAWPAVCGAMFVVGVLFTWLAYGCWLRVELG